MNYQELKEKLNLENIKYAENYELAPMTTLKIGGPARLYIELNDIPSAQKTIKLVSESGLPVFFLGGGSNLLIADEGFDGIVIKNKIEGISILNDSGNSNDLKVDNVEQQEKEEQKKLEARLMQVETDKYLSFDALNYDESDKEHIYVKVYSGTLLSYTIDQLIKNGITGLQWFAGIPGTIGGAVFNNIHGGTYYLSQYLAEIEIIDNNGDIKVLKVNDLDLDYDYSKLQESKSFILSAKLKLYKGDKEKAKDTAIKWAQSKVRVQPYNSAGSSFKNITKEEALKNNFLSNGWGYIIEKQLDLKGFKYNGAQISTKHAAFVENLGSAKAEDVLYLFDLIYDKAKEKYNLTPKSEIFFLGFPLERIKKFL